MAGNQGQRVMDKLTLKGVTHPGTLDLSEGMVSLGRNPTNDFRVSDPTVSSFHCELIVSGETVLVRDLNSTNGTFIDGDPVQEGFLRPWQTLRLGQAELRLEVTQTEEVVIAIPEIERALPETHLLDGRLACINHPGVEAVLKCAACARVYCSECVRPIGLKGGQKRLFCPSCSQPCVPLASETVTRKKKSFLGRLTETIRIRFGQH